MLPDVATAGAATTGVLTVYSCVLPSVATATATPDMLTVWLCVARCDHYSNSNTMYVDSAACLSQACICTNIYKVMYLSMQQLLVCNDVYKFVYKFVLTVYTSV